MKIFAVVLAFVACACGQQVTVNGSTTHADVPLLSPLSIQLAGPAGLPHYWGVSEDPGPSSLFGLSVPIGIGAGTIDFGGGAPMPASGLRTWSVTVPLSASLVGLVGYSAALFLDPSAPTGAVATNGVSFTLTSTVDAGPDVATFVDEGVVLSGVGNRDPFTGLLPPGTTFSWSVIDGPPGGTATLTGEYSELPGFVADAPGLYTVSALVTGPGVLGVDTCEVEVFDFRWGADLTGDIESGPIGLTGIAHGPSGATVTVNGVPTTGSSFAPGVWLAGTHTPTGVIDVLVAELTTALGNTLTRVRPVTVGTAAPLGQPSGQAAGVRLRTGGLNGLEPLIEAELASLDYNSIVTSIGTINAVNGAPFFSANITPTSGSLDTQNIVFDMSPDNGHVDVTVTFHNVHVDVDVTGELVFVNYTEQASIDASTATMTGELTFVPGANGALEIVVNNPQATLTNFSFTLSSFLNTLVQLSAIQDAIRSTVEDSLEATTADIVGFVNPLLADFAFSLDLSSSGIPLLVDFPMEVATYDADGVTLCNTAAATPLVTGPESPPLSKYVTTPATGLVFPSVTPVGGAPYGFSLCVNDDMLNQILAGLVASGSLDLDITGTLGTGMNAVTLTAGFVDLLAPGFGFGEFEPNTPLTLRLRHTSAPVVVYSPGSMSHGQIHIGGVRIDIDAEPQPGLILPVMSVTTSGSADVTLSVLPGTTDVALLIDGPSINTTFHARRAMAGSNPGPALGGLSFLMQFLLPAIVEPVAMVTIPAPPIGSASVLEVTGSGAWSDYLCAYFNVL